LAPELVRHAHFRITNRPELGKLIGIDPTSPAALVAGFVSQQRFRGLPTGKLEKRTRLGRI